MKSLASTQVRFCIKSLVLLLTLGLVACTNSVDTADTNGDDLCLNPRALLGFSLCPTDTNSNAVNLSEIDKTFIRDYEMVQYTYIDKGKLNFYSGDDIAFYPLNQNVVAIESSMYCDQTSCKPQFYKRIDDNDFCRVSGDYLRSADLLIDGPTSVKEDAVKQVLAAKCM